MTDGKRASKSKAEARHMFSVQKKGVVGSKAFETMLFRFDVVHHSYLLRERAELQCVLPAARWRLLQGQWKLEKKRDGRGGGGGELQCRVGDCEIACVK
jgi:hypothetical protein